MKRNIIFLTLGIALLLTMIYACEEFLDTSPKASASDVVLANEKGVNVLLIGAYAAIDGQTNRTSSSAWAASVSNWVWGDVASDDASKGGYDIADQNPIVPIETYTVVPSNPYLNGKWLVNYDGISRANDVLQVMAMCDPPLPEATQTSIKAQVLFIRGFIHFELKKVFNNIPYITEDVDPVTVPNDVDVWPKIEADLKFAADNLPTSQAQVGRATKYAAEGVLARVYMFQNKWAEAKVLLDDIINSGKYSLMTNFGDNHKAATRNNKESIFEIQYSVNDGRAGSPNAGWGDALNFPIDVDGTGTCSGFHVPTQNLVNAFQVDANGLPLLDDPVPNFKNDMSILSAEYFVQDTVNPVDPRLDLTIARRGVPFLDWGIMRGSAWIADQAFAGPYLGKKGMFLKKDKGILSTTTGWATGVNSNSYRLLRYAHILLWRAEVAAETGDFETATTLVNQIRTRAGNDKIMGRCRSFILTSQTGLKIDNTVPAANYLVNPYPTTFANLDYARKAIRHEMRLEFAMEGYRHFDLVRWGIAEPTINAYLEQDRAFRSYFGGSTPAVFTTNRNEYFPIPQIQIDLQPGILIQITGY